MNRPLSLAAMCVICLQAAFAQQALKDRIEVISPEIAGDNSVTFRLLAPNAQNVEVAGDFAPENVKMTKKDAGLWEVTTQSLSPELYSYAFIVDGLRITDPSNVYLNRDIATLSNYFIIPGERADYYKVNDVAHGSLSKVWYDSPTLGMKRRMSVYTPPGYLENNEEYPVLYLLHGAGGDEEAWPALGRAAQILDNMMAKGEIEPMIVVMTNGVPAVSAAPGESAEGLVVPSIDLSRMNRGDFIASFPDVVNFVDKNYRTKADKKHRAIAGLSMGGFHSLHISKQYPELFDYIGLFSSAIFPPEGSDSPVFQDFDNKLKTQFDAKPQLYWIAIGEDDFLYEDNKAYRKILDDKGYPYVYYESPDGHIWKNWRIYLTEFLPQLFKKS